jgi:hypothetical protein
MFILIVHSDCVALYKCKSALALEISVRILDNKGVWCLTPLSTIFQLYRGGTGQFIFPPIPIMTFI